MFSLKKFTENRKNTPRVWGKTPKLVTFGMGVNPQTKELCSFGPKQKCNATRQQAQGPMTLGQSKTLDKKSKLSVLRKIQETNFRKLKENARKLEEFEKLKKQKNNPRFGVNPKPETFVPPEPVHVPLPIYRNLIPIISDLSVLTQAHATISQNKGSRINPKGQDVETADGMNLERLENISKSIQNGTYTPSPVSQILSSKKKRPLNIAAYNDKIVSEAIRMVLHAIYDPLFEDKKVNHGFRPNRSPHTAMKEIQTKTQGLDLTIHGNVVDAFSNINHDFLLSILRERIHDNNFLKLVLKFCRAGVFNFVTHRIHRSLLGVPEGQSASPILFNIYFQKFDDFVLKLLKEKLEKLNAARNIKTTLAPSVTSSGRTRQARPSKEYHTVNNNIYRANKRLQKLIEENSSLPYEAWSEKNQLLKKELEKQIRVKTQERSKLKYSDQTKMELRFHYTRYAADWIIFLNCTPAVAEEINKEIAKYFETPKMTMQTTISDINTQPARFLGFVIGRYKKEQRHTLGSRLFINADFDRIISRLTLKHHCTPTGFPRESPGLSIQNINTIIEECNYILRGLLNYYYPVVTSTYQLQRLGYIMQYSAFKTIAQKLRSTVRKVIKKCGGAKRPEFPLEIDGAIHKFPIYNYLWLKETSTSLEERRNEYRYSTGELNYYSEIDLMCLMKTKANWRSRKTLLYRRCIVCG